MRNPTGIGNQVVRDLMDKFPNAATKTLARKAYAANPSLWSTLETCRGMVRHIRGQHGKANRKTAIDKSNFKPPGTVVAFQKLPPGLKQLEDWQAEHLDDVGTWLVMSDLHIPYHDDTAIRAIWSEAKKRKVVGILLNGDVADCFAVSKWEKDPRKRDFGNEIETLRQFFDALRDAFPKQRIVWKAGNHELRYQSYMQTKAPELLDIADFRFETVTHADKFGIPYFDDNRPMKLGKLWVIHGHEYRFAISNPVNPARGLFLRAQVSAMCGHMHQPSSHSEKNMADHVVTCWSTGCLCDLKPEYAPFNKWASGAAWVEVGSDGSFSVDNFRIIEGRVWS